MASTFGDTTNKSLMDKLREKPGIVAVGAAALATAGYLIYKSFTAEKDGKGDNDAVSEAGQAVDTEPEYLENAFFLDASAPPRENEERIVKWMNDQVSALLSQNDDGKLSVVDRKLQKEDFLRAMMIIQGRANVLSYELKQSLGEKRLKMLKD